MSNRFFYKRFRVAAHKLANVRLCLHQAIRGEAEDHQIKTLIKQYGISHRVFLNPSGVVDDAQLNLVYNACDVGINTLMGEGWGLVSLEHAATGAVQVVPDHTACKEIWSGRGELIPVAKSYIPELRYLKWVKFQLKVSRSAWSACTLIRRVGRSWHAPDMRSLKRKNSLGTL